MCVIGQTGSVAGGRRSTRAAAMSVPDVRCCCCCARAMATAVASGARWRSSAVRGRAVSSAGVVLMGQQARGACCPPLQSPWRALDALRGNTHVADAVVLCARLRLVACASGNTHAHASASTSHPTASTTSLVVRNLQQTSAHRLCVCHFLPQTHKHHNTKHFPNITTNIT
jgi:hypothetical protein